MLILYILFNNFQNYLNYIENTLRIFLNLQKCLLTKFFSEISDFFKILYRIVLNAGDLF